MASDTGTQTETYPRQNGFLPIGGYAAIGDCHTVALVGVDGAIDWMCAPEIDSPSLFGALLDPGRGGSFVLRPAIPFSARRRYVERTNVLQTTYETAQGTVQVTEAVTIDDALAAPWRELVRRVQGLSGAVPMHWHLEPRFGYGEQAASFERAGETLVARHGRLQTALRHWDAGQPEIRDGAVVGEFTTGEGSDALLAWLATEAEPLPLPTREALTRRLESTERVWRDWVTRHSYEGPYTEAVERSLLAIRLLSDGRTGAITAAGTTSLPEALHEKRNFDYRYAWVRDLSFTLEALMDVGIEQLPHMSIDWLLGAVSHTHPRVDPVYTLTGRVLRSQEKLSLSGYRGTQPVHLGNQAGTQLQLGGWGDLMETMWTYVSNGHLLSPRTGESLADMTDLLAALWRHPDAGLWELGSYADYTTSKVSCWTAFRRTLDLARDGHVPARHVDRWRQEQEEIERYIETQLWSEEKRSYLMKAGSDMLDCGVLLASRRGYGDPKGPRMQATIDAIKRELHAEGPLFYRYSGMQEQENAFLACSFWMVEALALAGRVDEARELMDGAVGVASDIGLFSEEMEPGTRQLRGNLPQALTHLSLVNAASVLAKTTSDQS